MVMELKESIWMMVELTQTLCMDIHTCLITLENNYALMETGLREEDDFELNYDRQEDRETVNSIMNAAFKNHKAKLHKHFKKFGSKDEALQHRPADTSVENWIACCELFSQPSYQERSRINTNNRAKLKVHHTGGSRPFVWHRKKLQGPRLEHQQLQIYIEKMVEIQSQSTIESGAPKDVDIFTQVLGTKSG
ncbi:hypothetical protein CJ030_MR1G001052 [Morella rubra]|uniref:Uncharacterized protein n=1 Tax=Morella rubra TaxID=262757 RepID=A0A6A1WPB0_9ROSI|nr:hypothetical protein CJ030_MR1G001052 [Morella rubra]